MKYRKLTSTGDYTFGKGLGNLLSNSSETVAQAVQTALALIQGEWFINTFAGVPYGTRVFGAGTKARYDLVLQSAILDVPGVSRIVNYSSSVDARTRRASVSCTVDTIYGTTTISNLPVIL